MTEIPHLTVTRISDLSPLGDPEILLSDIGRQVTGLIALYNLAHPGEMVPKTPSEIYHQFLAGESLVMITPAAPYQVLFHGTLYPLSEKVMEFGSVITHPDFRGLGLGTLGSREMVAYTHRLNHASFCISTVKQELTAWVLQSASMLPVSFYNFPRLTSLTCTCDHASACQSRRQQIDSTPEKFSALLIRDRPPGKIPCTLMLSDVSLAIKHEQSG